MHAGIISENTRKGYATYMKQFFLYCRDHQPDWLTPHCLSASYQLDSVEDDGQERPLARNRRIKALMNSLLDNIGTHPLLNLHLVTPTGFMGHIRLLRRTKKGSGHVLTEIIFLRMALKEQVASVVHRVPSGKS